MRIIITNLLMLLITGTSYSQSGFDIDCLNDFQQDSVLTNKEGFILDSIVSRSEYLDKHTQIITFYSQVLKDANEPILYNYYLGETILRFTYLRAFHEPVIIRINIKGNQAKMTTKIFESYETYCKYEYQKLFVAIEDSNSIAESEVDSSLCTYYRYNRETDKNQRIWFLDKDFISESFNNSDYNCPPVDTDTCSIEYVLSRIGVDGSNWYIEYHSDKGYRYIEDWSPDNGPVYRLGRYLFLLSRAAKYDRRY